MACSPAYPNLLNVTWKKRESLACGFEDQILSLFSSNINQGHISLLYTPSLIMYACISREDEIIMPDEHGGMVKENYLWKVSLP